MTSIQERLQISSAPLDKWSVREQLCLASAVACSGDQNWMSISRTLKIVCDGTTNSSQNRPVDWFSQKNCAVQYGHLFEDNETAKRKKRSSESSLSAPSHQEPLAETIVKRLTEERMQEIKIELKKEQDEYAKLYKEIKSIQNGEIDEDQLLQMWNDLEKEQEKERIEEMKLENQLRERELKKQELQRSWRTSTDIHSSPTPNSLKALADTTSVDMDVEEIIGSGKTILPASNNNIVQTQAGTSPLLSSLLKSSNAINPPTNILVTTSSVRSTAPTITTLLTGGSIPNQNQPALIPSHDEAVQLLTRPISGPPLDALPTPPSVAQTLLSPSQSAPTLSMLLEKKKMSAHNTTDGKTTGSICTNLKVVEKTIAEDSNNESVPMDIEEDLQERKIVSNTDEIQNDETDETDPNEEQQLLEVFKNIGNIEELDIDVSDVIDEEVDFLKGVDEETPLEENIEIEQKLEENFTDLSDNIKILANETTVVNLHSEDDQKVVDNMEGGGNKIEIISSDDSNDNIPLASLETSKERLNVNESSNEGTFLKDQEESANLKNELDQVETANEYSNNSVTIKQEMLTDNEKFNAESSEADNELYKQPDKNDHKDDIFVVPTVEDIKEENVLKSEKEKVYQENEQQIKMAVKVENEKKDSTCLVKTESIDQQKASTVITDQQQDGIESVTVPKIQAPPILIADADENSSSTDISVQTRKDDKQSSRGSRKSPLEQKTDDDTPNPTIQQIAAPNVCLVTGSVTPRPTALRKLRDRDRSESPMIDDDGTAHSDHSTTNQRSRRRYSSTPVIDSIPNSPASSDREERELRTSKKLLLSIYNVLYTSKYASAIQRILSEESSTQKLDNICLRFIDFQTIKKNIESGLTRSVYELQRDILWMSQNVLMVTKNSSAAFKTGLQFQQECQNIKEFISNGCEPGHKPERESRDNKLSSASTSKGRSGSRKSLRLS